MLTTQLNHLKRAVWLNGWVFVYELCGCGFESTCSHLKFTHIYKIYIYICNIYTYIYLYIYYIYVYIYIYIYIYREIITRSFNIWDIFKDYFSYDQSGKITSLFKKCNKKEQKIHQLCNRNGVEWICHVINITLTFKLYWIW